MSEGYKLYGGNGVEIEPLEVFEDGTYTAPIGKAFNPVKVSGGGSTGGGVMTINLSELVTPSADGTESNSIHGSNGVLDSAASYVYPGTFEDLGNLDAIKGFWVVPDEPGNEAALWGNIIIYSEDEAEDPANVSEGELALTATTPVVSVETTSGIYALLPTGTVFAPGTGR